MTHSNLSLSFKTLSLLTVTVLGTSLATGITGHAATTLPDSSTPRAVTIHALQGDPSTNQTGTVNDGTEQTVTGTPLQNVTYTATLITPTGSAADMAVSDYSTYTVGSTVVTGKTGSDGTVELPITTDGYYLLHQVSTVNGVASMQDAIVQVPLNSTATQAVDGWLYDINVYPKTDLSQDNAVNKTVEVGDNVLDDQTGTAKQATVFAGSDVTWNLSSAFSDSLVTDDGVVGSFEVSDTLNSNFIYKAIHFMVGNAPINLSEGADYSLSTTDGKIDLQLTKTGIQKVKAAKTSASDPFVINLTTSVANDYKYGQIGNSYSTSIKNAYGVDLSNKTVADAPSQLPGDSNKTTDVPEVYLGALKIKKIDSVSKTPLAGATFKLIKAESASAAQALADSGEVTATSTASYVQNPTTGSDYSLTTGADGEIEFDGLALTDSNSVSGATSSANTHYYAIETQAPKGYNRPTAVVDVTASIDPTTTKVEVSNNLDGSNIKLPFTGGQGLVGILVIAAVAGTSSIVIRRRKGSKKA